MAVSNEKQLAKMKSSPGFVAALDQSGGSTPQALRDYGVNPDAWKSDEEMFTVVHQMRTRIITSPAFNGNRILGAILFEGTMDRDIEGQPTADFLWNKKQIVPFLKVDKGLSAEQDGVQLMKPMPQLGELLSKANAKRIEDQAREGAGQADERRTVPVATMSKALSARRRLARPSHPGVFAVCVGGCLPTARTVAVRCGSSRTPAAAAPGSASPAQSSPDRPARRSH